MTARALDRGVIYGSAVVLVVWVLIPLYLVTISAFAPQANVSDYPKALFPSSLSAGTIELFLQSGGVVPAMLNSLAVASLTVVVGLVLGAPAAYALARFSFRGDEIGRASCRERV